jgi:hypothetical protein
MMGMTLGFRLYTSSAISRKQYNVSETAFVSFVRNYGEEASAQVVR